MRLSDLEAQQSYESVLRALRTPGDTGGAEAVREPGHLFMVREAPPSRTARRPLRQLLDLLRRRQVPTVRSLLASPLIDQDTTGPGAFELTKLARYAARGPRPVARRFVNRLIRDARASGLQRGASFDAAAQLDMNDALFAELLTWAVDMSDRPPEARTPLGMHIGEVLGMDAAAADWARAAGDVVGLFVRKALGDTYERREPHSDRELSDLATALSAVALTEPEAGASGPVERVPDTLVSTPLVGTRWVRALVNEGARRLAALGGGEARRP